MICTSTLNKYCCDDISLIENYDKAINDPTQMWDCHHRLETDMNMSYKELKEKDLYYNRPANELIFLTKSEHYRLHTCGKHHSEEQIEKQSIISKELHKTKRIGMYDKHHSEETKKKQSEAHKLWWAQKKGALN